MSIGSPAALRSRFASDVRAWGIVAAGVGLVAAVVAVDVVATDRGVFDEGPPLLSPQWVLRSVVLALSAGLVVWGSGALMQRWKPSPWPASGEAERVATALTIVITGGTALLILSAPDALTSLVSEDRPVEWLSALCWFAAGGLLAGAAVDARRGRTVAWWPVGVGALVLAGTYLFIGLEEVSWFQRVLDVETRGRFLDNGQQEINFHNFATQLTGQSFFLGTFLIGGLLPFLLDGAQLPPRLRPSALLVPGRSTLLLVCGASAMTYELWNIAFFQLAFFMSLGLLVIVARRSGSAGPAWVACIMAVVQLVVAVDGDDMGRAWDETEVRELLIPIGMLFHAGAVFRAVRRGGSQASAGGWRAAA